MRNSSRGSTGLARRASAPSSVTRRRVSTSHRVLATITGIVESLAERLISASKAKPSSLGISRSVTTRPNWQSRSLPAHPGHPRPPGLPGPAHGAAAPHRAEH